MRYYRILMLYFNQVFQYRARAFVYFLMSLVNPFILIFFWKSVSASQSIAFGIKISDINSYYLLLIIATGLLIAHIEEEVGVEDIKEGQLSQFLLKPFSYFVGKFMLELTFRLMRSIFSIVAVIIMILGFGIAIQFTHDPAIIFFSLIIALLAFILSFVFKMTIALIAFWIDEIHGIFEIIEVALIVLAGNIMPIAFFPGLLKPIALSLPFSYMVYFPVIAIQGKLNVPELFQVVGIQIVWIIVFSVLYNIMWSHGIKKFTGIGQ